MQQSWHKKQILYNHIYDKGIQDVPREQSTAYSYCRSKFLCSFNAFSQEFLIRAIKWTNIISYVLLYQIIASYHIA